MRVRERLVEVLLVSCVTGALLACGGTPAKNASKDTGVAAGAQATEQKASDSNQNGTGSANGEKAKDEAYVDNDPRPLDERVAQDATSVWGAYFPDDGRPAFFLYANGDESWGGILRMVNGQYSLHGPITKDGNRWTIHCGSSLSDGEEEVIVVDPIDDQQMHVTMPARDSNLDMGGGKTYSFHARDEFSVDVGRGGEDEKQMLMESLRQIIAEAS